MRAVTLNYAEIMRLVKAFFFVTAAFTVLITFGQLALVSREVSVALIFQSASVGLVLTTVLMGLLADRPWTFTRLARWLGRPSIHGVWWGTLCTDWVDANGRALPAIPIVFVIRQSYLFVSIQSFSENQPARSTFEFLGMDEKTKDMHLAYVYELRRTAYNENKLTSGYGHLILQDQGRVLAGEYWTNSPTQGRLRLEFVTQVCDGINSYDSAVRAIAEARDSLSLAS